MIVDALNRLEVEPEKLKTTLLKSNDSLVKLIWYANFKPRQEEYSMADGLEQLVQSRCPSVCSWPKVIR